MKYHVKLTQRAVSDLEALFTYIGANSSQQAFAWFNSLTSAIFSLERLPDRGSIHSKNKKLRQLFFGNSPHVYKIIYKIEKPGRIVNVLHIRHCARSQD